MNDDTRQLGAFVLILAASCVAVSLFVLSPLHEQNTAASAKLSSAQAAAKQLGQLQPMGPLWDTQLSQDSVILDWYEQQSELAADPATLHARVSRSARANNISISSIDPHAAPASSPADTAISTGLSIEASGSLKDLTAFLQVLTTECGFVRIDSINIMPIQDENEQIVRASIQTAHLALQIPEPQLAEAGVDQ